MPIDWFTTAAQILNFLVLVYLLKRFLYGPIIRGMERREQSIAASMEEAERKVSEAEGQRELYEGRKIELEKDRKRLMEEAASEAGDYGRGLMAKAREEVEEQRAGWRKSLAGEKDSVLAQLMRLAGRQTHEVARRALGDLAGRELEGRITDVFMARLRELEVSKLEELRHSVNSSGRRCTVSTAFELPPERRREIAGEIKGRISGEAEVLFEIEPGLLSGIELRTDGHVVGWNLDEYLRGLEEEMRSAFERETGERPL